MPPIFFYFIGTVTGGFSSGLSQPQATPITIIAEPPGFLKDQIDLRLRDNDFAPDWQPSLIVAEGASPPRRVLTIDSGMSDAIANGDQVGIEFDTASSALRREFEIIRVQKSIYTALADVVVAKSVSPDSFSAEDLVTLNSTTRIWTLETSSAGARQTIPTGFQQAVPGILVMFTLLVLLTSGGSMLVLERNQGFLRRLASAPLTRNEVVLGKWCGRMALASLQITAALLVGTFFFRMNWGPDFWMVLIVLAGWAGFCATAVLFLGSVAKTEGQVSGIGVLTANLLAALSGCWWPIEIAPEWMQFVQKLTPTGWTMDALHRLISFQSGPESAVIQVLKLVAASLLLGALTVRTFKFQ